MNLKVANLVAIQFGMFFGIMSWLAYSQLPFGEPRTAAEVRKPMAEPVSTYASASNPAEQRSQTVDYSADQGPTQPVAEQPAAPLHEYSAAAVQQNSALAAQLYYQQIAPRRYASSGVGSAYVTTDAPSYAQVAQAPEVIPAEYEAAPQTVAHAPPNQIVVYSQPTQLVAFSNQRGFANRCRPTPSDRGVHIANMHRRPNRPRSHLIGSTHSTSLSAGSFRPTKPLAVVHRRNDSAPSCRPNQNFSPRGRR